MTKRLTLLFALLLQVGFMIEAKQTSTKEGIEIIPASSSIQIGSQHRTQPVTVDITGHTL